MNNKTVRGFTLVESLVMLLVLAMGMAVSVPLFVSAMKDAQTKQCRANMQAIANAEEQYKIKSTSVPRAYTTTLTNLVGDFPVVPVCPNGGTYTATISNGTATAQNGQTVPSGMLIISCSVSGDGKYAPTIDAQ